MHAVATPRRTARREELAAPPRGACGRVRGPVRGAVAGVLAVVLLASVAGAAAPAGAAEAGEPEGSETSISTGSPVDDSILRLYLAFFEREPDPGGLAYWSERYRRGQRLASIGDAFARSAELAARYGELGTGDFVILVYLNVLGRAPDAPGYQYWASRLHDGTFSRGHLVVHFAESAEFVALTGTLPPEPPPPVVPAGSGSGRRIVYCVSCQHVWLVEESGYLARDYPVSGRAGTPRAGTYQVFSKSELTWAGYGGVTMRYMVRYTWGRTMALGFHSIPQRPDGSHLQSEEELGQYRSAGCTRQRLEDARYLYHWAPVGTTVVVLP